MVAAVGVLRAKLRVSQAEIDAAVARTGHWAAPLTGREPRLCGSTERIFAAKLAPGGAAILQAAQLSIS